MVFAAALATIFMAAIEGTIVATAMPTIVGSLGGVDLFSWIFGAYLLTQAILIPIYGRLSDLYGRKPVLLFGIGVFLVGSALCGLAWNMISLIVFRVVQGIGAGALIPVSQTVVADIYSGEARARMQGYISSTFGSAAIIGPMIGGLIATHVSWRAIFWINIPLGIIAASLLAIALKEEVKKRRHHIDYVGAVLLASATTIIMIALIHADTFSIAALAGAFGVSAMLIAALIFYESRTSEPMIPVRLYRDRLVAGGNWVGAANGAITMAVIGFLPVYMQGLMGSSTLMSGVALGAMSVFMPFGGFVGSRLVLRMSYRLSSTIGAVILVTGSTLLIWLHPGAHPLHPIIAAGVMGLGMGITTLPPWSLSKPTSTGLSAARRCRVCSSPALSGSRSAAPYSAAYSMRDWQAEVRSTATSSFTCSRRGANRLQMFRVFRAFSTRWLTRYTAFICSAA